MMNTENVMRAVSMAALHQALIGYPGYMDIAQDELEPMQVRGLFHAHVRIRGAATILRIPRVGSFGLPQPSISTIRLSVLGRRKAAFPCYMPISP